jgi:hypothetical protein
MAKKIAKIDADNMNSLYAGEYEKLSGSKTAAAGDVKDQNGAPEAEQAFKDHEEYLDVLQSALKADASQDHDPNDKILD